MIKIAIDQNKQLTLSELKLKKLSMVQVYEYHDIRLLIKRVILNSNENVFMSTENINEPNEIGDYMDGYVDG